MSRRNRTFSSVVSEGGLLPPELLSRIQSGDKTLNGLAPETYHLAGHERIGDAANRAWSRLTGLWSAFQNVLSGEADDAPATGLTRERWLLPLFQELGYGRLTRAAVQEIDEREYAISHLWQHSPIHLVGCRVDIDRRQPGVAGAAKASPHGLVQDYLNRSDAHLWGIVSNGYRLRLLRDHHSLTRQAYVEFDLEAIMDGEQYSEFLLLWLVCHQSRVEGERPEDCWLEKWFATSREEGIRALDKLRGGMEKAIEAFGSGFLAHPANRELRERLERGELDKQDYYRQLLRLVYRLIFLFVAEERDALLDPTADEEARQRYERWYATRRYRELAMRRRGGPHGDLWLGLTVVMDGLYEGRPELALPALGGFLWGPTACPDLMAADCANEHFLEALRHLGTIQDGKVRYPVNWRNVGAEELGSIYESLLELHPRLNREAAAFELDTAAGHERKTTGSYYTPSSLVECLLDSALEPVMDEAVRKENPARALLDLSVCDPACGSGHFLLAAARRIARRLAAVRSGEEEPSPAEQQHALREVVGNCLYGVDINPMAVELCKVALWMEALEPGRPLSFLDHHIRVGNSLLGTTPELIQGGLPDGVFKPIEGDDKKVCSDLKKRNKTERDGGQRSMLHQLTSGPENELKAITQTIRSVEQAPDDTLTAVRDKAEKFTQAVSSDEFRHQKLLADAWCAAFVWHKAKDAPATPLTTDTIKRLEGDTEALSADQRGEVSRLAEHYQFFHWHLAFPEVMGKGRFDCVLGNPPWERVKIQEKEWFAGIDQDIANAPNAAERRRRINKLSQTNPSKYQEFKSAIRKSEGVSSFVRSSTFYPLCGKGDINLYAIFAELMTILIAGRGRIGTILPSGLVTDNTTRYFFQNLMLSRILISLYEFENEGFFKSAGQGHMVRFGLTTIAGPKVNVKETDFVFQGKAIADLNNHDNHFTLSKEDVELLNPNTQTCPIFSSQKDALITIAVYRRIPTLIRDETQDQIEVNNWGISFKRMFDMANDSHLFQTRTDLINAGAVMEGNCFRKEVYHLPLYEAKMIYLYNHRFGDFFLNDSNGRPHILPEVSTENLIRADYVAKPHYWVSKSEVFERLPPNFSRSWLVGWRDVTDSRASARTAIFSIFPLSGVGHTCPIVFANVETLKFAAFVAISSSYIFDYSTRQKVAGLHLTYSYLKQLPYLSQSILDHSFTFDREEIKKWVSLRVLELVYNSWDLEGFAQDCGWNSPPFRWDEERRFLLRCELDAAFFHLYLPATPDGQWKPARISEGAVRDETPEELAELMSHFPTPRHAVDYIMETFPTVKKKDEKGHGEYRTKRVILEIYDAMQAAIRTGHPYQTRLDPPPADPRVAHPESTRPEWAKG